MFSYTAAHNKNIMCDFYYTIVKTFNLIFTQTLLSSTNSSVKYRALFSVFIFADQRLVVLSFLYHNSGYKKKIVKIVQNHCAKRMQTKMSGFTYPKTRRTLTTLIRFGLQKRLFDNYYCECV